MLTKIISGGQTGVDQGALEAAKILGLETGGWISKGWKTENGPRPDLKQLYNLQEHHSYSYASRTHANVRDSDATLRIAQDFNSAGEKCTLNAIKLYEKPHYDINVVTLLIDIINPPNYDDLLIHAKVIAKWIIDNNIHILNVAGHRESKYPGIKLITILLLLAINVFL